MLQRLDLRGSEGDLRSQLPRPDADSASSLTRVVRSVNTVFTDDSSGPRLTNW